MVSTYPWASHRNESPEIACLMPSSLQLFSLTLQMPGSRILGRKQIKLLRDVLVLRLGVGGTAQKSASIYYYD